MRSEPEYGYVYILSNPCFKKKWLKIGKANNVGERACGLKTSTPYDFVIEATFRTRNPCKVEKIIHDRFRDLCAKKSVPNKEFFEIDVKQAIRELERCADMREEIMGIVEYKDGKKAFGRDANGKRIPLEKPIDYGPVAVPPPNIDGLEFIIDKTKSRGYRAIGYNCKGGFVVRKGSTVNSVVASFYKENNYKYRVACEKCGAIKDRCFVSDYVFKTPAIAASVVTSYSEWNDAWKTVDGKKYREVCKKTSNIGE